MTLVTAQMTVSLDGFYAGPKYESSHGVDWVNSAEAKAFMRITRWAIDSIAWRERLGFDGGETNTNSEIIAEAFASAGAYVMGRRMMDGGEAPWGDTPPFHAPVFVVTHRPKPVLERLGGTSFTYVTDGVASAIQQARAAAGAKNVAVAGGGTLLRQVLKLGLLDELELHIVPVIVGDGMRLLDKDLELSADEGIELTPLRVVNTPDVTHIRYRVEGRAPMGQDYRVAAVTARSMESSSDSSRPAVQAASNRA